MPGRIDLFKDTNYKGEKLTLENITDQYPENALHAIKGALHDEASSMTWDLPPHVIAVFYEHDDGTGRQYAIWGKNGVVNLDKHGFDDEASSWRWVTV